MEEVVPPASEWRPRGGQYLGEISALCFLHLPPLSSFSSLPLLLSGASLHLSSTKFSYLHDSTLRVVTSFFSWISFPVPFPGSGSQVSVHCIESGELIRSFHVFEGIRVHGITCCSVCSSGGLSDSAFAYSIAVYGERRVKLFKLTVRVESRAREEDSLHVELRLLQSLPKLGHWVLDVCFLKVKIFPARILWRSQFGMNCLLLRSKLIGEMWKINWFSSTELQRP